MKAIMRDKSELKDSGIEYLGHVPKNWKLASAKFFVSIANGSDPKTDGDVPVYGSGKGSFRTCGESKEGPAVLLGRKGTVDIPQYIEGKYWNVDTAFDVKAKSGYVLRFFYYLSTCFDYKRYSTQTALPSMTQTNYNSMRIIVPDISEQEDIISYLDDCCSKIDAIIDEAKASIEEYKELKQAVIYEAVTKGLDKNAKMKDSSIEWLGSIPAQWNLVKTNRIIDNTQNGLTRRDLDKSDGQIVLKLKNINAEGEIDYSDTNRIQLTNDEIEKYRLHNGDLLFVRVNGSRDLVGKCAIFEEKDEAIAYNDHIIRVTLNDYCIPEYVKWYLLCDSGKSEIALKINTAAGQFTISGEGLRAIYMPLPSLNEQREIVEFLNNKTKKIDFIINEKQSLIEDLDAYKKSLIYEVVTGKRKVVA